MAQKVNELCQEKLEKIINDLGYELVEVEYAKKNDGQNLTFVIDKPNGILIEDCELVHKTIDPMLDEINPTNDNPYILNVCSPGLDRPIKNYKDFLKNKGKEVEVRLYAPYRAKKSFIGKLIDYSNCVVIEDENSEKLSFDLDLVAIIVPVIKF